MNNSDLDKMWQYTQRIVWLLSEGEFEKVIEIAPATRFSSAELEKSVCDYYATLCPLTEDFRDRLDPIEFGENGRCWQVDMRLRTLEEGVSDLEARLLFTKSVGGEFEVEVLGVLVP